MIGGTQCQAVQREHGRRWPWISMQMVDIISYMSFAFSTYLFVYMTYHFSAFCSNTCLYKLCRNYIYSAPVSRKVRTYFVDVQDHWTRGRPSYWTNICSYLPPFLKWLHQLWGRSHCPGPEHVFLLHTSETQINSRTLSGTKYPRPRTLAHCFSCL